MKVCVSATSDSLDSPVDLRFERSPYFIIMDLETMQFEVIPNPVSSVLGGAGVQAAQIIAGKGVKAVISGKVGPNAFQALSVAGIKIIKGAYGTVREAIEKYKRGELKEANNQTSESYFGMGAGAPSKCSDNLVLSPFSSSAGITILSFNLPLLSQLLLRSSQAFHALTFQAPHSPHCLLLLLHPLRLRLLFCNR